MALPIRILFLLHGVVTAAAGVVLIAAPALIPSVVGIALAPDAYLLSYLLAAMELGVAVISILAIKIREATAVRVIAAGFVMLHVASAVLELVAIAGGADPLLWGNVAVRVVVALLFAAAAVRSRAHARD